MCNIYAMQTNSEANVLGQPVQQIFVYVHRVSSLDVTASCELQSDEAAALNTDGWYSGKLNTACKNLHQLPKKISLSRGIKHNLKFKVTLEELKINSTSKNWGIFGILDKSQYMTINMCLSRL